jgi:hypothetical protein
MQDARWLRLKDCLLDRGWTSRDEALCAPHETMWFSRTSNDANLTAFRDQIRNAAEASAQYTELDLEHAALHDDLVSLVDALDEVFQN